MTYCVDDLCHGDSPICGAGSPFHCRFGDTHDCDAICDVFGCPDCPEDADDDWSMLDPPARSSSGEPQPTDGGNR